jgi:biopolymer transport protein ExbD
MAHIDSSQGQAQGRGRSKPRTSTDFELNLAPIIDCMVVLISFLLISLSYLSIHLLDAGITGGAQAQAQPDPNTKTLEIRLAKDGGIEIKKEGAAYVKVANDQMEVTIAKIIEQEPRYKTATLEAEDAVQYEQIVKVMDGVRKQIPSIVLSGF